MNTNKQIVVELFLQIGPFDDGIAGSDVNHKNVSPDKDEENKRTLSASLFAASPHWMMNQVACSMVEVSS
jgi:hypothetical protein